MDVRGVGPAPGGYAWGSEALPEAVVAALDTFVQSKLEQLQELSLQLLGDDRLSQELDKLGIPTTPDRLVAARALVQEQGHLDPGALSELERSLTSLGEHGEPEVHAAAFLQARGLGVTKATVALVLDRTTSRELAGSRLATLIAQVVKSLGASQGRAPEAPLTAQSPPTPHSGPTSAPSLPAPPASQTEPNRPGDPLGETQAAPQVLPSTKLTASVPTPQAPPATSETAAATLPPQRQALGPNAPEHRPPVAESQDPQAREAPRLPSSMLTNRPGNVAPNPGQQVEVPTLAAPAPSVETPELASTLGELENKDSLPLREPTAPMKPVASAPAAREALGEHLASFSLPEAHPAAVAAGLKRLVQAFQAPEADLRRAIESKDPQAVLEAKSRLSQLASEAVHHASGEPAAKELQNVVRFGQLQNATTPTPDERVVTIPVWWASGSGEIRVHDRTPGGEPRPGESNPPTRVVVDLRTPHLQRVRIDLLLARGQVNCQVAVQDQGVASFLQPHLADLRAGLEKAGVRVNALGVRTMAADGPDPLDAKGVDFYG